MSHHHHPHQENSCCAEEQSYTGKVVKKEAACCSSEGLSFEREQHHHDHEHSHSEGATFKMFLPALFSALLLAPGLIMDFYFPQTWFSGTIRVIWYLAAYLPVAFPVIKEAILSIINGDVFSEFFLMTIATIGAFAIGEYPEGVAVMLFYTVGELFQSMAVSKAKTNIKALLDLRPEEVNVIENNQTKKVRAELVKIGDVIQLKSGEQLALDGELISEKASFNTAALTGESKPETKNAGEMVLAGMINLNTVSQVKVAATFEDSKLSKILEMVQNATAQKAPTELFIRKFAKIYTPIMVGLALLICLLPYFFVEEYQFSTWLYRALVFLVISCPCALVISIPLGYFGGIGAASKNGILFKGSNFLDQLANIQNVVMDKTGTLTEGVFAVQEVHFQEGFNQNQILKMVNGLENYSSHPVASAIHKFVGPVDSAIKIENIEEVAGHGLKATVDGKQLLVGNFKLLDRFGISNYPDLSEVVYTVIAIGFDGKFAGYLTIADKIKEDAASAVSKLKEMGVSVTMLSGDKNNVVQFTAKKLGISHAFGELLPEDKVDQIKKIIARKESVAFVGDGMNDAPVIALSDVGIAMGGLGSDATIETADVVIQDDKPTKIATAINIGKQTRKIVWQNITLAFIVKALVLILGAGGLATMWEAVFADVGVALLAILNAVRIQQMKFN